MIAKFPRRQVHAFKLPIGSASKNLERVKH
jgi:hypothetical protein